MVDVKAVRDRLWHYLEPSVASSVGLTLEDLKQVLTGTRSLQLAWAHEKYVEADWLVERLADCSTSASRGA
jgi:hypothetical protein